MVIKSLPDVSLATEKDIQSTLELFQRVTDHMLAHGIDQWNYDYPDEEIITEDIANGHQFVIRHDGMVIATVVLNEEQDAQYELVHWHTRNIRVLVIHRLAVHPEWQGKGLGKRMCKFAESYAAQHGYGALRLDAYADNPGSNALYVKMGFARASGYCYFRKKVIPFYCYDKVVNSNDA